MMAIQAQFYQENLGFSFGGSMNTMENGYGFNEFCVNLPQKQDRFQSPCFENNNGGSFRTNPVGNPNNLAVQMEKQRLDMDRFINLQNERLRLVLQEQRKQQTALILRKHEAKAVQLLKQKEAEIAKAMNRTMELQEFVKRMEMENQSWQRVATENEAMVESLNNAIEQMRVNACLANEAAEEAESCCDNVGGGERNGNRGRNIGEDDDGEAEQSTRKMRVCESCHYRDSCVVLLPCRHLCSCKDCYAFLDSCPVCGMTKKAGIEALI